MKKKLLLGVIMLLMAAFAHAQKTYVLLTGINNYGTGKNNLNFPVNDAKDLKQIFEHQGAIVALLTSKFVTKDNINKKLDAIIKLAKPEDKVIFFFSGHGGSDVFCCYRFQEYHYSELALKLSKARTDKVFCFIDACHSGSAQYAVGASSGLDGVRPVFCMASRPEEYSSERFLVDNGIFTQALIKALRGKADYDGNRAITLMETFKYVHNDVIQRSANKQHPQLAGNSALFNTVITKW